MTIEFFAFPDFFSKISTFRGKKNESVRSFVAVRGCGTSAREPRQGRNAATVVCPALPQSPDSPAQSAAAADLLRGCFKALAPASGEYDVGPLINEAQRDFTPEPARSPRNDNDASAQLHPSPYALMGRS